jgi:hypothetical protein
LSPGTGRQEHSGRNNAIPVDRAPRWRQPEHAAGERRKVARRARGRRSQGRQRRTLRRADGRVQSLRTGRPERREPVHGRIPSRDGGRSDPGLRGGRAVRRRAGRRRGGRGAGHDGRTRRHARQPHGRGHGGAPRGRPSAHDGSADGSAPVAVGRDGQSVPSRGRKRKLSQRHTSRYS